MNLYKLEARRDLKEGDDPWNPWYDKTFGFVIRAENEQDARQIAHENAGDENRMYFLWNRISLTEAPWLDGKYSTCTLLTAEGESGVILSDIHEA